MVSDATQRTGGLLSVQKLIGTKVVNPRGEALGKIEDLLVSAAGGQVACAVVSFGGVLSLGSKLFAFPWSALEMDGAKKRVILPLDRQTLSSGRGFEKDRWPDMTDWTWNAAAPSPAIAPPAPPPPEPASETGPLKPETVPAGGVRIDHWGESWQSHGLGRS